MQRLVVLAALLASGVAWADSATWPGSSGFGGGALSSWEAATAAKMQLIVPQLTEFKVVNPGTQMTGGAAPTATDPTIEGGAIQANGANSFHFFGTSAIQHPKTGQWAIGFAFKTVTPHSCTSHPCIIIGLGNTGLTHNVAIGLDASQDATHFLLWTRSVNGALFTPTTVTVDATKTYSGIIANNGSTLSLYINGSLACSVSTSGLSSLVDEAFLPSVFNETSNDVSISKIMIGYVGPTFTFENNSAIGPWAGLNANYMDFAETSDMAALGMTAGLISEEYQRDSDSGVKAVRTWFGNNWVCALGDYPTCTGGFVFNTANMTAFYSWLTQMQSRGIAVLLTFGWTWPTDICEDMFFAGSGHTCTPTAGNLTTFASMVSAVLNNLLNTKGYTNIRGAMFFTEPDQSLGTPPIPNTFTSYTYYANVIQTVRAQLSADDGSRTPVLPRVKLIGPEEAFGVTSTTTQWVPQLALASPSLMDIWAVHTYCFSPPFAPMSRSASLCPSWDAGWITNFRSVLDVVAALGQGAPYWPDEIGVIGLGNFDVYRWTGDYGMRLLQAIAGPMSIGAQSVYLWMLQDQTWVAPNTSTSQAYGVAGFLGKTRRVRPSWYSFSTVANLVGGSLPGAITADSSVYRASGGTPVLHGVGFSMPSGVANCTDGRGCLTFMVVNESGKRVSAGWQLRQAIAPRTFYRYVFDAENPPSPLPDKPASLMPWDQSATVSSIYPENVIPGHSVVVYSTIDLKDPSALSLSSSAVASASSVGSGAPENINDGNTTHCSGALNSWAPNAGAVGAQWAELDWLSPVTLNRLELDFVATSEPTVYADYTTTAHPSPLTGYTVQWNNNGTWTDFVPAVSSIGNTMPHRTHTFATVTTSAVRITVPSPSSAPLNEMAVYNDVSTPDTALAFYGYTDPSNLVGANDSEEISVQGHTFASGDVIEYDVRILDKIAAIGSIDVTVGGGCVGAFSAQAGWKDQNNITGASSADLTGQAYAQWYHRSMPIPACAVGQTSTGWFLVTAQNGSTCSNGTGPCTGTLFGAQGTAYYDNIKVTNSGSTVATIYANGSPDLIVHSAGSGYLTAEVTVTAKS